MSQASHVRPVFERVDGRLDRSTQPGAHDCLPGVSQLVAQLAMKRVAILLPGPLTLLRRHGVDHAHALDGVGDQLPQLDRVECFSSTFLRRSTGSRPGPTAPCRCRGTSRPPADRPASRSDPMPSYGVTAIWGNHAMASVGRIVLPSCRSTASLRG